MAWETIPKIVWGANTLNFGYPLEAATSWSEAREGSEVVVSDSGDAEDAWITGYDYFLAGEARWIPPANTTNPVATGWDGAAGWRAFLEWAWQRNSFVWYPDKNGGTSKSARIVLPEMKMGRPQVDPGILRTVNLQIKAFDGPPRTAFDGY
ncbi:MAG: hypothetical protein LC798_13440 [Chloroflexi bacterium]|nr:hypothetical protein [Chloroflexota bacterium]